VTTQLLIATTVRVQAAFTAVLLAALVVRAARPQLARWLQPMLAVQYLVQALWCTSAQAFTMHHAAVAAGCEYVVWPLRVGAYCSFYTLLCVVCWPMQPRYALPLLAVRAALPAAGAWDTRRYARLWPFSTATGAAMQVAACVFAAAHTLRRERRMRLLFEQHTAAAALRLKTE
jgi:hypothetical protein